MMYERYFASFLAEAANVFPGSEMGGREKILHELGEIEELNINEGRLRMQNRIEIEDWGNYEIWK